jgi:hypothetical protein
MIDTTTDHYWEYLQDKLISRAESWDKIQIVWIFTHSEIAENDSIKFIKTIVSQYTTLLQRMQDSMSNLKQVFFSGFHYTGYTHPSHHLYESLSEPKAYWGNIAIKTLIERQIAGDPELAFEGPGKKVPYLAWGPYFWADGTNPRLIDSLIWPCEDYRDDDTGGGFHLEQSGKWKEAQMLMNFFENDPVASKWYLDGAKWNECAPTPEEEAEEDGRQFASLPQQQIQVYPNRASNKVSIELPDDLSGKFYCAIYNSEGQLMMSDIADSEESKKFGFFVNNYSNGIYLLVISDGKISRSTKFIVQR